MSLHLISIEIDAAACIVQNQPTYLRVGMCQAPGRPTVVAFGKPKGKRAGPYTASVAYFACLGAGFIAVELTLLQHLTLLLGHPIFTLSILLFSVLAFGGMGSILSVRVPAYGACLAVTGLGALAVLTAGARLVGDGQLARTALPLATLLAASSFTPVITIVTVAKELHQTLGAARRFFGTARASTAPGSRSISVASLARRSAAISAMRSTSAARRPGSAAA